MSDFSPELQADLLADEGHLPKSTMLQLRQRIVLRGSISSERLISTLALIDSAPISDSAKSGKVGAIIHAFRDTPGLDWSVLQHFAIKAGAATRQGIASHAPAQIRQGLFGGQILAANHIGHNSASAGAGPRAEIAEIGASSAEKSALHLTALILSIEEEPQATRRLLWDAGFSPMPVSEVSQLDTFLADPDIGLVIVYRSFLLTLDQEGRQEVLRRIFEFSTFSGYLIEDCEEVGDVVQVSEVAKEAWCADAAPFERIQTFSPGSLNASKLSIGKRAAQALSLGQKIEVISGELADEELSLLRNAIACYVRDYCVGMAIDTIRVNIMRGGHSGARVVEVQLGNLEYPVVVKVAPDTAIRDEGLRYRQYIRNWDKFLAPKFYFHAGSGVVIFALVDDASTDLAVAPVLGSVLDQRFFFDVYAGEVRAFESREIVHAIRTAISRLVMLNRKSPPDNGVNVVSRCSLTLKHLVELGERGCNWGLDEVAIAARDKAVAELARCEVQSILHGDVHLRNVLIRARNEAAFIDYGNSGVGHPLYDLVKFELSLFLSSWRGVCGFEDVVEFQRALSIAKLTFPQLERAHPEVFQLSVNGIIVEALSEIRRAADQICAAKGLSDMDYFFVKVVLAWQSLTLPSIQTQHARGVIVALSAHIATAAD